MRLPTPVNDQNRTYLPHSPERAELKARLKAMAGERVDMPLIIAGREVRTGSTQPSVMPHNHRHVLGDWHAAEPRHVNQALEAAPAAAHDWSTWSFADRAAVFLRAAELLTTTWRPTLTAPPLRGPGKAGGHTDTRHC